MLASSTVAFCLECAFGRLWIQSVENNTRKRSWQDQHPRICERSSLTKVARRTLSRYTVQGVNAVGVSLRATRRRQLVMTMKKRRRKTNLLVMMKRRTQTARWGMSERFSCWGKGRWPRHLRQVSRRGEIPGTQACTKGKWPPLRLWRRLWKSTWKSLCKDATRDWEAACNLK